MKQTQTIITGVRAGVSEDNLNRLQRSEPFQRAGKSSVNRKPGFSVCEEGYAFARGRASADPVVERRLHIMGCCKAAGEGAVLRLFTDPPKSMDNGAEVSPGSLKHGVLVALGWKLGYHRCSDSDTSCSHHLFIPVEVPSRPFTTTRRVSALLYWTENATSLSSPHELSFLELCPAVLSYLNAQLSTVTE